MRPCTTRHWTTLSALYLERARRAIVAVVISVGPLSLLFAHKSGYRLDEVALNFMVVSALLPLAVGGVVGKCKADGSLAFLASLPVSRAEHAKSWFAVIVLLTLPLLGTSMAACYFGDIGLRGGQLVAAGVGVVVITIGMVMGMVAVQLSAPPATAAVRFVTAMSMLLLTFMAIAKLFAAFPAQMTALLQSELLIPVASLLLWTVAIAAVWWSWRRIGHYMTNYVGDPPGA